MADREIKITIVGDAAKAKQVFTETGAAAGTFEGKITGLSGKFSNFGSVVSGVVAAGAIQKLGGFLMDGAKGAAEDAAAMDRLKVAVTNTGTSYDAIAPKIDAAIKNSQKLAFTDGETANALSLLTAETGSSEEALARLSAAQDLARGTGMSLEQAAKLLGKVSDENTAVLGRYGITVEKGATAQDLLNKVDAAFGGQAAAFAESDAGKWANFQNQVGELQETLGGMLIPVLTTLATTFSGVMTALEPVTSFIADHIQPIMIGLAAAIATVVIPAFVAWAIAAGTAAIATITALAPVILTAAAVGAAVAALYLAWNSNFLGIRDITMQVIDFVRPYIETAMAAIQAVFQTVWPIISAIVDVAGQAISTYVTTYIGIVRSVVETVLPAVQVIFETVWGAIKVYVETVMAAIQLAVQLGMWAMKDIVGPILGETQALFQTIWDAIKGIIDTIAGPAGTIVGGVTNGMQAVYDAVAGKLGALRDYWDGVWGGMKGVVDSVISAVAGAWNFVAGIVNSGISVWNGLSLNFDTGIPGVPSINWNSPDIPYLPTIGGSGAGYGGDPKTGGPLAGVGGSTGGGAHNPSGGGSTGGGQKPPPTGDPIVDAVADAVYGTLSNTGPSTSRGGGAGKGGMPYSSSAHPHDPYDYPGAGGDNAAHAAKQAAANSGSTAAGGGAWTESMMLKFAEIVAGRMGPVVERAIERGMRKALSGVM